MNSMFSKQGIVYRALRKGYHVCVPKSVQERVELDRRIRRGELPFAKEEFIAYLSQYDVISFDIFDTLLTRLVYRPDDVFLIMAEKLGDENFLEKRKKAEQLANQKLQKDVNLDEIYQEFRSLENLTLKQVQKIQKMEMDLEIELCVPRRDMVDVVKELVQQGKKVIFTSDMYLKESTILKMLEKCGYRHYEKLYLSNSIDKRKDRKDMWPFLKKQYPRKKIVHIGDNRNSDFAIPREFHIQTVKIPSSRELFEQSSLYAKSNSYIHDLSDSLLLGLLVNKTMFNSPFRTTISSLEDFAYVFHAPILNEYLHFICEHTTQKDELLFLAREGYYLQKLYQDYTRLNAVKPSHNVYFLTSRKAASTANIQKESDVYSLLDNEFTGTICQFFKNILEVEYQEEDYSILLPQDKDKVKKELKRYMPQILKVAESWKDAYLKYIEQTVPNYQTSRLVIADLGYSGTIQYQLTKLLKKEFVGFYVTNSNHVKRYHKNSELNFLFDIKENDDYQKFYFYSLLLEFFLSAPYGQLQHFVLKNQKPVPVYNQESFSEFKKANVERMYRVIVRYMKDYAKLNEIYPLHINKELICSFYTTIVEDNYVDREVKDCFEFTDAFAAAETRNAFKIISRY